MKKWILRILMGLLILIVLFVGAGFVYFNYMLPNVSPAPDIKVEITPDRLERGEYLAVTASGCVHCHGGIATDVYAQPLIEGTEGAGGRKFDLPMGTVYTPNLTPYALGNWTDGEIYRAITVGVDKDGNALFPLMPYHHYSKLSDEDIYSVIAYIRNLKPIEKDIPDSEFDFPFSLIMKTLPKDKEKDFQKPDRSNLAAYGEYMMHVSACSDCHTPMDDQGQPLEGMAYAGGMEFPVPTGGIVRSSNITPDEETGIGKMTEEEFIHMFKKYTDSSYVDKEIAKGKFNTEMPWKTYSNMAEEDLKAIYHYLMKTKPVKNKVVKFTPPEELEDGEISMN